MAGIRLAVLCGLLLLFSGWGWSCMIRMPGSSHQGDLPDLTGREAERSRILKQDVVMLAETIGIRNTWSHAELIQAAEYIEMRLKKIGLQVERQEFEADGKPHFNLQAEVPGTSRPEEIVVVGAHYDSVIGCPGANDNATGIAALLAIAEELAESGPERTLRFVAFANEEPPHFQTDSMGSAVYAKGCRERGENITAMISLETLGCYLDEPGTQKYPPPFGIFYPDRGNFVAIVGNISSRKLVHRAVAIFRESCRFPSEGAALPGGMTGIGWSDHWAFWEQGYPAIMFTDTAPFRYEHYHLITDTPDRIDYDRCARVVSGILEVVRDLGGISRSQSRFIRNLSQSGDWDFPLFFQDGVRIATRGPRPHACPKKVCFRDALPLAV